MLSTLFLISLLTLTLGNNSIGTANAFTRSCVQLGRQLGSFVLSFERFPFPEVKIQFLCTIAISFMFGVGGMIHCIRNYTPKSVDSKELISISAIYRNSAFLKEDPSGIIAKPNGLKPTSIRFPIEVLERILDYLPIKNILIIVRKQLSERSILIEQLTLCRYYLMNLSKNKTKILSKIIFKIFQDYLGVRISIKEIKIGDRSLFSPQNPVEDYFRIPETIGYQVYDNRVEVSSLPSNIKYEVDTCNPVSLYNLKIISENKFTFSKISLPSPLETNLQKD